MTVEDADTELEIDFPFHPLRLKVVMSKRKKTRKASKVEISLLKEEDIDNNIVDHPLDSQPQPQIFSSCLEVGLVVVWRYIKHTPYNFVALPLSTYDYVALRRELNIEERVGTPRTAYFHGCERP